ncbi:leucine-rich repeat domain-containing protein [Caenispirillum salinarum]|uniref:leucine-rich repeat domain-containing protein n=1 Tax=Caenispirillum salinarum TaxID=859058 RepID=UPI0012670D2F|nr:leucine-rich repeat domain-containing protein [Caenispirillum salinarum]
MTGLRRAFTDLAKSRSHAMQAYLVGTVAGIVVGALFVIAGFVLAILGISGAVDFIVEANTIKSKLTNASPGVVFATLGAIVLWRYKPRSTDTVEVDSEGYKQTTTMLKDEPSVALPSGESLTIGHPVIIPDDGLAGAISEALSKQRSKIGHLDLQSLTGLEARERGIRNLDGLEGCANLEILNLEYNNISDVSNLASLKKLRVLSLNMNPISNTGPLSGLANLEILFLGKCGLSDARSLLNLKIIHELSIVYNEIEDLSPLMMRSS